VTRLVAAQALVTAAVGLPFSRGELSSALITLALAAGFCLLTWIARTGTRAAWLVAVGYEIGYFGYGLSRFIGARYLGGSLFALVILGVLAHPAVARAYSAPLPRQWRGEGA
jgi:hypothetical protein